MTNCGSFDGPNPAYEVLVLPFAPVSKPHLLLAICDVPVLPASVYPGTAPAFANHCLVESVSIAVIFCDDVSPITLLIGIGSVTIVSPSGYTLFCTVYGCMRIPPFAKAE